MSVPTELRGKHKNCGGAVVFRPATRKRELLAGESVTLQSACRSCGATIAVEYRAGEAPRTIWERPVSEFEDGSPDSFASTSAALFVPRDDAAAHMQATRLEAPVTEHAVEDETTVSAGVEERMLVAAGASDAWVAVAGSHAGGGSSGVRERGAAHAGGSDANAVVHLDAWRAAGRGGARLGGRGAALPGRSRGATELGDWLNDTPGGSGGGQEDSQGSSHHHASDDRGGDTRDSDSTAASVRSAEDAFNDDARARALLGDAGSAIVYEDAPEPVITAPTIDELPLSRTYASQFAHRFEAARDAVRRVKDELPSVLADDSRWATPQLSADAAVPQPQVVASQAVAPDVVAPQPEDLAAHAAAVIAGADVSFVPEAMDATPDHPGVEDGVPTDVAPNHASEPLPTPEALSTPETAPVLHLPALPEPAPVAPMSSPVMTEVPPAVVSEVPPAGVSDVPSAGVSDAPQPVVKEVPLAAPYDTSVSAPDVMPMPAPESMAPQHTDALAAMFDAPPAAYEQPMPAETVAYPQPVPAESVAYPQPMPAESVAYPQPVVAEPVAYSQPSLAAPGADDMVPAAPTYSAAVPMMPPPAGDMLTMSPPPGGMPLPPVGHMPAPTAAAGMPMAPPAAMPMAPPTAMPMAPPTAMPMPPAAGMPMPGAMQPQGAMPTEPQPATVAHSLNALAAAEVVELDVARGGVHHAAGADLIHRRLAKVLKAASER